MPIKDALHIGRIVLKFLFLFLVLNIYLATLGTLTFNDFPVYMFIIVLVEFLLYISNMKQTYTHYEILKAIHNEKKLKWFGILSIPVYIAFLPFIALEMLGFDTALR